MRTELGDFTGVETLKVVHVKAPEEVLNMEFIYCFDRMSYGLAKGWREFVEKYNLEEGDKLEFYKSNNYVMNKEYEIDFHKTSNENEEMPLVAKKTIHKYGYDMQFLFEKELCGADVSWTKVLEIPTAEAEEHLPPLKQADGSYKEIEDVVIYDAGKEVHWMAISHRLFGTYYICEGWDKFVCLHNLCKGDIIRFFKLIRPFGAYYLIDYVRAKRG